MVHNQQDYKPQYQSLYIYHALQVTDFLVFIFLVKREIGSVLYCGMPLREKQPYSLLHLLANAFTATKETYQLE
jgi:hypothetical protein